MVSLEIIGLIFTGLSISISIIYYANVLRNANITRQAQLFMNIYSQINSNEANGNEFEIMKIELKTAEDYLELLNDKTKYVALNWFMSYYEGMGVLVRQGLVGIDLVAQMQSGGIIWFWERYRDAFLDCRVKMKWDRFMIELEYLYDRVKEYMVEHHPDVGIESPNPTG